MASPYPEGLQPVSWFKNDVGEVSRLEVPERLALPAWQSLRSMVPQTGRWPILMGDSKTAASMVERKHFRPKTKIDLAASLRLDARQILDAGLAEIQSDFEYDEEIEPLDLDFEPGEIPYIEGDDFRILTAGWSDPITLALLPSPNGWEAPAHFGYGSRNSYPPVEQHAAMLRYFQETYGAELVVFSSDTVELRLLKEVKDPQMAKQAAIDWYVYSPDNVEQGVESVEELTKMILGAHNWFSWWD